MMDIKKATIATAMLALRELPNASLDALRIKCETGKPFDGVEGVEVISHLLKPDETALHDLIVEAISREVNRRVAKGLIT